MEKFQKKKQPTKHIYDSTIFFHFFRALLKSKSIEKEAIFLFSSQIWGTSSSSYQRAKTPARCQLKKMQNLFVIRRCCHTKTNF